jgi:hypothetical protein
MMRLFRWLLKLFSWLRRSRQPSTEPAPPPKTIVTLLVFPTVAEDLVLDVPTQAGDDKYYTSFP